MDFALQKLYTANNLSHQLDKLWFTSPLIWNSKNLRWEYRDQYKLQYFVTHICFGILFLLFVLCAAYIGAQNPDICSLPHLAFLCLQTIVLASVCGLDALICFDGAELAGAVNWCYQRQKWIRRFGPKNFVRKSGTLAFGHTIMVISITFVGAIVAGCLELDPFIVFLRHFMSSKEKWIFTLNQVCCTILYVHFVQVFTNSYRTLSLTAMLEGFYRIALLKILGNRPPSQTCIQLYKEIIIVMELIHCFEYKCTAIGLAMPFFIVVVSVSTLYLGYIKHLTLLIVVAGFICVLAILILNVILMIGCTVFESSSKVLKRWKEVNPNDIFKSSDKKYFKKLVSSLRVINIPAGQVGIIDKEIKVNYLQKLLDNVVSSIMMLSEVIR